MSEQPGQNTPVSIAATLAVTQRQRNNALDENAMLWAHVEQLTAERDRLAAELEQLRGGGEDQGLSAVTVHTPNGESILASRTT
ncbi:hypothetical protein [Nonomuraea sp. 10N515B]|uniref:hypothetical protein n=1 Tax=Nonomuraea sp. 10N515B TaxID=3457422 RepID=UPI003FCE96C6